MRHIATRSRRRSAGVTAALAAVLCVPLSAHDFWIQPSSFTPSPSTVVRLHLRVGDNFPGEPVVRDAARIETFFVHGPDGRRPVAGQNGGDPAGLLRVVSPGTYLIGYRSRSTSVTLGAPAFEQYLKEEGLEQIIALRARKGQTTAAGRERFSRSVKSLLQVGTAPTAGHDTLLGLTLELVPEVHPSTLVAEGTMEFRLLYEGQPLEGALVVAIPQSGTRAERHQARTAPDGRVALRLAPGAWTVKAVHMVAAPAGAGFDWESTWTSLTFKAGGAVGTASR